MATLDEIKALLQADLDLWDRIVRSLGSSTVALFGIYYVKGEERLKFAGTGTLAVAGNYYGILTAAHVWEVLEATAKVAITMTDKINHRYGIDVKSIKATVLEGSATEWGKHGPDIAFLRIPNEFVGEIEACHVFEDLEKPPKKLCVDAFEYWMAMGTPGEFGTFSDTHASVEINGSVVDPQYLSGSPDYYDFQLDANGPGIPKSYGGFSGGGLWRLLIFSSPTTGKVDWAYRLKGVMFWEFEPVNNRRVIRCQGYETIASLLKLVPA
ncbi:MAG: hypothetical protein WCE73_17305 [Candidatus Angelobacter sp.]